MDLRRTWLSFALASQLTIPAPVLARTGFAFVMTGGAQIPPVTTTATGGGSVVLSDDGTEALLHVEFAGLLGDYVYSHVHGPGTPSQVSGLRITFVFDLAPDLRSGTCDTTWALSSDERDWLAAGLLYVNVHSDYSLNGEIRGQILPDKTPAASSTIGRLKRLFSR